MPLGPRRALAAVLLTSVLSAACTSDITNTTEPAPTAAPAQTPSAPLFETPTVASAPTSPPTPAPPTATSEPTAPPQPTTEATPAVVSTPLATSLPDLPGNEWDLYVPLQGLRVAVVGVAFDDILEVHAAPGENSPLVGTFAPLEDQIMSAGEGRSLPSSIWWRVTLGDVDGWVGSRFMTQLGATRDITSEIVDSTGSRPVAETMVDLGTIVANERASVDPPSRVVISQEPIVGDLGEIIIDVVGFPDDSVGGERLHIFGQPLESGDGFSLMAVEATVMCVRGVTAEGLCL